jgi:hypothetical protein
MNEQTGGIWVLNTVLLEMVIHVPWYHLIDGAGGICDEWTMELRKDGLSIGFNDDDDAC